MRLAETIAAWFGRVELVLAGAEGWLREGESALAAGDGMRARAAANALLARVPGSPIGLALLADACELAGLDAELAMTLEQLALRAATRADVWVRLARVRELVPDGTERARDAYLRALAVAEPGAEARREALVRLADLDLTAGDGVRAELWLDRIAEPSPSGDVALRHAEARLLRDDLAGAEAWIEHLDADPANGRAALARGRALAGRRDARAFVHLLRATVLDAPGAAEALSSALGTLPSDEALRARVRAVVDEHAQADHPRWRAAFARAEGRRDDARAALASALSSGDASVTRALLDAAVDDRDSTSLALAVGALAGPDDAFSRDARRLLACIQATSPASAAALDALSAMETDRAAPWAESLRERLFATWLPPHEGASAWAALLDRLDHHARDVRDLTALGDVAGLSIERTRPVRLAIVGEFNAGKSTFINALIGADVAPTGVLPTTATLHHLRYAPDAYARILLDGAPERVVPIGDLKATLRGLDTALVRRVEILMPLPQLTRVEVLDTPGFNAPDPRHTEAARGAFEEADFAIWLLDAAQAMKHSERVLLDEAKRSRLPVQLLINKADRLSADDRARVIDAVRASLAETGITSLCEPIAMSAKLALAGKLGDAAAFEASSWGEVEALLERAVFARSDEIKERALRRRASRIVQRLRDAAVAELDAEVREHERVRALAEACMSRAAIIDRDVDTSAAMLAGALGTPASAWRRDLDVVAAGRGGPAPTATRELVRYRVDRAVSHLGAPLASVLASLARPSPDAPDVPGATDLDISPIARTIVRAYAHAGGTPDELDALARAAIAFLVEHLSALAERFQAQAPRTGRLRELDALARALA